MTDHDAVRATDFDAIENTDLRDLRDVAHDIVIRLTADRAALAAEVERLTRCVEYRDSQVTVITEERDAAEAEVERQAECLRQREDYLQRQVEGQRLAALSWQEDALAARARVADLEAELAEARGELNRNPGCVDTRCECESHTTIPGGYRDAAPVRITPADERNPTSGLIGLFARDAAAS